MGWIFPLNGVQPVGGCTARWVLMNGPLGWDFPEPAFHQSAEQGDQGHLPLRRQAVPVDRRRVAHAADPAIVPTPTTL